MEPESKELVMTFDPHTIEHLGIRMYSTLPPVLAELIANAYDADAKNVKIILIDSPGERKIIIEDDGCGMSFKELNDKFLRIGRNRRYEEGQQKTPEGRKIIGKKGLGKLSFFGIAQEIEVETSKNGFENSFVMDWNDIKNSGESEYHPKIINKDKKISSAKHETKIILKKLQKGGDFSSEYLLNLADNISKIFIIDPDFRISMRHNYQPDIYIKNERKYDGLDKEIEWKVPEDVLLDSDYDKKESISGYLLATKSPISPKTNMKGITLFSRKKLVNAPGYFSNSISSHFFSYITGWLEVDFIDDLDEDVISTNRQSLNWDHPEMEKLQEYLRKVLSWLEKDWREKRSKVREEDITKKTGINISNWYSTLSDDLKSKVKPIVDALVKDSELSEEVSPIIKIFHDIVPDYPKYHWRHLHPEIQLIAFEDYKNKDYFDATEKASRLYIQKVKDKAIIDIGADDNAMDLAFNLGNGKLMVTSCSDTTEKNIQNGQHNLSKGVVLGCRNPLIHNPEYQKKLVETGLFVEKDCLDMLSIMSHLFRRLDEAKLRKESSLN